MAGAALWVAIGILKTLTVGIAAAAFAFVAMVWWICVVGRPVVEFNPRGIVVRNLFRAWRIRWTDVNWIGEGWTVDALGGGWTLTICTNTPLSGVRYRDVPLEEQIRRKQGELPRHLIGCRATRPARRRPDAIVEAVRRIAAQHEVPVRFAAPRRPRSRHQWRLSTVPVMIRPRRYGH